eukprot:CAMPEP_0182844240 /NCGR_PEP_ID=MMETSP0006_2-20121128/26653_1 /TAXON_ID=97485 /ORGANISM="Prymnesium parvum, Strain Texoma1" /LENGTH=113 /DNA_ID=CAMNT_0024974161 /DNA_START=240 /DNA_END=578 /DNA_ORIENTATION=+
MRPCMSQSARRATFAAGRRHHSYDVRPWERLVVPSSLPLVRQGLICCFDPCEHDACLLNVLRVLVGVPFLRQAVERSSDLHVIRAAPDAEHLVMVPRGGDPRPQDDGVIHGVR